MWEEHSSAAISGESKSVQYFSNILFFFHLLCSLTNKFTKLLPFVCDNFTTTKTSDWNYHLIYLSLLFFICWLNYYYFDLIFLTLINQFLFLFIFIFWISFRIEFENYNIEISLLTQKWRKVFKKKSMLTVKQNQPNNLFKDSFKKKRKTYNPFLINNLNNNHQMIF